MSHNDVMIVCSDLPARKPLHMCIRTASVHLHICWCPHWNPKCYKSSEPLHLFCNPFFMPVTYIHYMQCGSDSTGHEMYNFEIILESGPGRLEFTVVFQEFLKCMILKVVWVVLKCVTWIQFVWMVLKCLIFRMFWCIRSWRNVGDKILTDCLEMIGI